MEGVFSIESDEDFMQIAKDILNNLYHELNKPTKLLNENILRTAKDEIKDIIFKTDCVAETVYELLISKGLQNERSKLISSLIENRKSELLYATLLNYNSSHGTTVTEVDWAVKLVYGTSELKKLKYPMLQLAITTLKNGQLEQQIYDVDQNMLVNMISVLESINTSS